MGIPRNVLKFISEWERQIQPTAEIKISKLRRIKGGYSYTVAYKENGETQVLDGCFVTEDQCMHT